MHGWEEWGEACVTRFRGMFAFALWDRNRECLFLARDRVGIKPLYYAELPNGEIAFASELKGITCHRKFERELDPQAVEDYFAFGYIPEPKTIFKRASKLSPAHTLLLQRGSRAIEPRQYWDVPGGGVAGGE